MDVHIHANCQAIPIAGMLREAEPDWRVTWFEVHGPEIIEHFDDHCARIRTADLVISQPIHQGYRGIQEDDGKDARTILNRLTPTVIDPNAFTPEFKGFLVKLEKA